MSPCSWVLPCLNLDFLCAGSINIFVLSDFSQDKLIGIVLNIEFIGLHDWLDHETLFGHCVILLKSLQLLLIDRPDVDIFNFFPVKFKMLLLLADLISLIAEHTMNKIFLHRVITVKIGIFIIEIGVN
jgi:hypothetical protein